MVPLYFNNLQSMDFKKLQSRKRALKAKLTELRDDRYTIQKREDLALKEMREINKKLDSHRNGKVVVTDHAIVRYMERVKHLDVQEIKDLIVPEEARKVLEKIPTGSFPVGTHIITVKNRVVTTVLSSNKKIN